MAAITIERSNWKIIRCVQRAQENHVIMVAPIVERTSKGHWVEIGELLEHGQAVLGPDIKTYLKGVRADEPVS